VLVVIDPHYLSEFARTQPPSDGNRPSVLVVYDSAGVRQLIAATLAGAGFDVTVAGGAREAVERLAEVPTDALVVDYSMPRSSGVDLVRALRAAGVDIPIVMVSGVATPEEQRAAWEAGVDAYMDKFDLRKGVLTTTLRRLDRKSTRLNSSHVKTSYAVFCLTPPPPVSSLFPYTTLFRSCPVLPASTWFGPCGRPGWTFRS